MPRRNQRISRKGPASGQESSPSFVSLASSKTETGPGGFEYYVRNISGSRATKNYRCPGCDHEIKPGVAHIVSWPIDASDGIDDRRHWHSSCWGGRATRSVTRRWS